MKKPLIVSNIFFVSLCLVFAVLFFREQNQAASIFSDHRKSAVVKAVQLAAPAVVNISTFQRIEKAKDPFGRMADMPQPENSKDETATTIGSGVIIDHRGFILTNEHVISMGSSFQITLADNRKFSATVKGSDADLDLAILQIDNLNASENLPLIRIGKSKDLLIGETVIAIGNPYRLGHTVTSGIVSALSRNIRQGNRVYSDFIQTDAPIYAGSSGGPLLNINGEMIGINTAVLEGSTGIGFAIPIDNVMRVVEDLIEHGEVRGVWLGMFLSEVTTGPYRLKVAYVHPQGPAATAKIRTGDFLLAIDGKQIDSIQAFRRTIRGYTVDNQIRLSMLRDDDTFQTTLKALEFPRDLAMSLGRSLIGIGVAEIPNSDGVLVDLVQGNTPARIIGIKPGDIIRQVGDITIRHLEDYKTAVIRVRHQKSILLLVQRGEIGYYISLRTSFS